MLQSTWSFNGNLTVEASPDGAFYWRSGPHSDTATAESTALRPTPTSSHHATLLHKRHDETTHITPYTDNNKTPRLTPVHHTPPHTTPRHTTHRTITHGSIPLHTTPHHTTPNRVARRVVLYIVSKGSIYRYVSHGIFDISYRTRCALHALASPLCCLLLYRYYTERKRPYTVSNIEMVSISFLSVSVSYRTRFRHRYPTVMTWHQAQSPLHHRHGRHQQSG